MFIYLQQANISINANNILYVSWDDDILDNVVATVYMTRGTALDLCAQDTNTLAMALSVTSAGA